ncbi:hypothetical protein VCRA2122O269_500009 [Vibrio crassostreae]|nr:hypothetical protein VCRA2118O239_110009 [Vibrio crassostreae]CAK2193139.1 hypothetical protein VCRA2116O234_610004 [Vibrio crassostreae]CAK2497471.1 hypothetical protein VCRA2113O223_340029 [Vibrio crassostreae]CAK2846359.1 hypothetical protein VCRA2113O203_360029 [Vibrio crassostreae]CAK3379067.1 hypothetical protein VCRA2122O270_200028 [Vibrio crassostreae]
MLKIPPAPPLRPKNWVKSILNTLILKSSTRTCVPTPTSPTLMKSRNDFKVPQADNRLHGTKVYDDEKPSALRPYPSAADSPPSNSCSGNPSWVAMVQRAKSNAR